MMLDIIGLDLIPSVSDPIRSDLMQYLIVIGVRSDPIQSDIIKIRSDLIRSDIIDIRSDLFRPNIIDISSRVKLKPGGA